MIGDLDANPRPDETGCVGCGCLSLGFSAVSGFLFFLLIAAALWLVRDDWAAWWRGYFGEPVLHLLRGAVRSTGGNVLLAFVIIGAVIRLIPFTFTRLPAWMMAWTGSREDTSDPRATARKDIAATLRDVFEGDLERMSLHLARSHPDDQPPAGMSAAVGGCCLVGLLSLAAVPVWFCLNLAVYDGLIRLFAAPASASIGQPAPALPGRESILGFDLAEHSLTLTAILGAAVLAAWYLRLITISGWTRPRGIDLVSAAVFLLGLVFCYFTLIGAVLFFLIVQATLDAIVTISRLVFKGRFLALASHLPRSVRAGSPDSPSETEALAAD